MYPFGGNGRFGVFTHIPEAPFDRNGPAGLPVAGYPTGIFRHIVLERPLSQRVDVWSSHVLGTESDPEHPRRDSAQNWEISQQFEWPADSQGFRTAQDVLDPFVLHNELDALGSARREIPAPLDNLQFTAERILPQKSVSEEICNGHRILNREIDADAANR
ncbi:MAG TPA: hypothetical protein VGM27_25195 [Acidobacteriaceae bacterium]